MKSIAAFMLSKRSESDPGYSTEELDTGKKWIDGKPVYRKVFNITTPSGIKTWGKVAEITNCDTLIFLHTKVTNAYNSSVFMASSFRNDEILSEFRLGDNGLYMYCGTSDVANKSGVLIVEYTKTDASDNA